VGEGKVGISWCTEVLNSLYGCRECSKGCNGCYARLRIFRFSKSKIHNRDNRYSDLVETFTETEVTNGIEKEVVKRRFTDRILFNPAKLYACLKFPPRSLVFVDEFSDLLHHAVPMEVILEHFRVFRCAPWLQFQVLTKRANRLAKLDTAIMKEFGEWPPNVWMGVSVCTPEKGELNKIVTLGRTHAEIKWISFEPWVSDPKIALKDACPDLTGMLRESGIAWSVIGGESGSKKESRLMTLDDAQYLFTSSEDAGCKVHFKQLGTKLAEERGVYAVGEHRSKGGNLQQIPLNLRKRDWPEPYWEAKYDRHFEPHFDPKELIKFG